MAHSNLHSSFGKSAITVVLLLSVIGFVQGCETLGEKDNHPAQDQLTSDTRVSESNSSDEKSDNTDPLTQLGDEFRRIYASSTQHHFRSVVSNAPYITQDLLNMTLHLPDGRSFRYEMEKERYFLMARSTHPPLALYALLSSANFKNLDEDDRRQLTSYQSSIDAVVPYIENGPYVREDKIRAIRILVATSAFITQVVDEGGSTLDEYEAFVKPLRETIKENLYVGALEQLTQFREKMNVWRSTYPDEDWENLRVVVLGFHNPRVDYALKLFFEWLVEEPDYEERVVYAEYQFGFFGDRKVEGLDLAKELLTKVDFERVPSEIIFDDPSYLQRDVMGPAAIDILERWGPTDWE